MSGEHVEAGRDAYVAGGDIHIHRPVQSGAAPSCRARPAVSGAAFRPATPASPAAKSC